MLKNLLFLSLVTTIAIATLIGFNYYHNTTTSSVPEFISTKNVPIAPVLDITTVEKLNKKDTIIANLHEENFAVQQTESLEQNIQTSPAASPGANF